MNNISSFTKCSNCGACYNICPKDAIAVEKKELFYSVEVKNEVCINCGMCVRVCPVNSQENTQNTITAYAAYNRDQEIVKKSSSGGVFTAIAKKILSEGGVVFGAAYSKDFCTISIKSTDEVCLEELTRSKYVESLSEYSFRDVKRELEKNRKVLFCGAPCQVAGLKKYLGRIYENLLTCDFSCGGMPSHKLYIEYLKYIEKKLKAPICEVNFRPKTYGWMEYAIKIRSGNGKEYNNFAVSDPYYYCFIGNHLSVREYCYECTFANNHASDIILADFWKVSTDSRLYNDDTGLSLIISNSNRGNEFIQGLNKELSLTVLDIEKASYNLKKKEPSEHIMQKRTVFLDLCQKEGLIKAVKKSFKLKPRWKMRLKYKIKKILRGL